MFYALIGFRPELCGNRGWPAAAPGDPLFGPNRGYGWPISGATPAPLSGAYKWANIEASASALMARKEGRLERRRVGRDFPIIRA